MPRLHQILDRITESPRAAGLEVLATGEGYVYRLVLLRRRKGKVLIEAQHESVADRDALKKLLKPGIPVYLALTGRGIVHKQVPAADSDDVRTLLPKVLPNAAPADFYVQCVHGISGTAFVSVVRRQTVDQLLEELRPVGDIVSCSLGALSVSALSGLLGGEEYQSEWVTGGQQLRFSGGALSGLSPSESNAAEKIRIGEEQVPALLLTAFAAAFGHFTGMPVAVSAEQFTAAREEFRQKRRFRLGAAALLVTVLLVLLVNYLAFQHYWDEKGRLDAQLSLSGGEWQRYQLLEKKLSEKQQFLEGSGLLRASRTSFYADELAADLPAELTLTRLNLMPRLAVTNSDTLAFQPGVAVVEGWCRQSVELNRWIGQLKEKNWIRNVSLQSYNQAKGDDHGEFSIRIDIH